MLLDQRREAQAQAGQQEARQAVALECRAQKEQRTQRERHDEVLGIGGRAQHGLAEREQRIGRGRGDAGGRIHQPSAEDEDQRDGQRVGDEKPQVNGGVRAAEQREENAVDGVDAGHLHVVRLGERRDSVQQQARDVGVLALVTIERDVEEGQAKRGGTHHDEGGEDPRHPDDIIAQASPRARTPSDTRPRRVQ